MTTNRNDHLKQVLETHDINKVENIDKFIAKKNEVKDSLANHFSKEKATNPIDSGSYAKKTANNNKFDIDACIPFKKKTKDDEDGFSTLEDMYNAVYDYLKTEYAENDPDLKSEDVRKQKVSIGLKFNIDGDEFEMDVVPGRERPKRGDYNENNTDLTLYIHPSQRSKKEVEDNVTHLKTNIKKHIGLLSGSDRVHERKIARLLKVWKTERKEQNGGKLIKSFMMELYTKEAFDNAESIPSGLWEKVKMVMNHIVYNIESNNLVDPANSNNIVSDSMSDTAKSNTKSDMKKTIKEVDEDADKIKEYFPANEDHIEDEDKNENSSGNSGTTLTTTKFG